MTAPRLVKGHDGLPKVMDEEDVAKHLGRTRAVAGRRNSTKLYLPLHAVEATVDELRQAIMDTGLPMDAVILTFRCGRRDGIAQITLGALLDVTR